MIHVFMALSCVKGIRYNKMQMVICHCQNLVIWMVVIGEISQKLEFNGSSILGVSKFQQFIVIALYFQSSSWF